MSESEFTILKILGMGFRDAELLNTKFAINLQLKLHIFG